MTRIPYGESDPRVPRREIDGFRLRSEYPKVEVTYTATDFGGQEQLGFEDAGGSRSFRGPDEVRSLDTDIGLLVSVTLESVPDLHTITFSVLLPTVRIDVGAGEAEVTAVGVRTTARTTIAGAPPGPAESYETLLLTGVASAILT